MALRHKIGRLGETLAERFLVERGFRVIERNARVHHDEIDLVLEGRSVLVGVEVKTSTNGDDPLDAVDDAKLHRVQRAADSYRLPIDRIDLIAVTIGADGVTIRWLKGVA